MIYVVGSVVKVRGSWRMSCKDARTDSTKAAERIRQSTRKGANVKSWKEVYTRCSLPSIIVGGGKVVLVSLRTVLL